MRKTKTLLGVISPKAEKAQVTLFIILGIIILLLLGFGIYLATQAVIKPKISAGETPIESYVQDCIKQTAIIALKKIGDNGGYLSFENEYREFNLRTEPAEGDALIISEAGMYSVPYWWYMKTPNTCNNCYLTTDNMPLLPEIEEQINTYVSENLDLCLKGFGKFANQYVIKTQGTPSISTQTTKDSIIITAEYQMEIKTTEKTTKLNKFQTEINVKIKDILDLAKEITEIEKKNGVIEERIMHMLSAHMGASYDKIPPISEITHDYYLITWTKELVKKQVQQILNNYAPLLRFYGTKNAKEIKTQNKYAKGFYNAMQIEEITKKYSLYADISYNDWPIYFSINPEPITGTYHKQNFPYDIMPPFQTNTYEFYYDLSVPLLVQIRDPSAFNGEGYTMNFAIEANIRDNKKPNEWNIGEGTLGPFDSGKAKLQTTFEQKTFGTCTDTGGKYQCSIDSKNYDTILQCNEMCYTSSQETKEQKPLQTRFCAQDQKLSGKIKIISKTGNNILEEAGISYRCGNYKACAAGITNENGIAEIKLPICTGGILSVHKPGYYADQKILSTEINKAETLEFNLQPEKEFTISFQKMPINAVQGKYGLDVSCCPQKQNPISTQKATLSLEKINENSGADFIQAIVIDEDSKIRLIPGKYKVTMQYFDEIGVVIPAECKKICTEETDEMKACRSACEEQEDFVQQSCKAALIPKTEWCEDTDFALYACQENCAETKCKKWMKLPEENIIIRPALLGGAVIDSDNGYWTVTEADINSGLSHITFYVLEVPTPTCLDNQCSLPLCAGLDEMSKTKQYSDMFREELEPKFS